MSPPPIDTDDHDREALAKEIRDEFDAIYHYRWFGRGWRAHQWEKLTWRFDAARWTLFDHFREDASVEVDSGVVTQAVEALARSAELREVDDELGAAQVKWVAERLNRVLPADRRIQLSEYGGGPWEWLAEDELESFRSKLARELGVRYLEHIPRRKLSSDRALRRLIAKQVASAEDGEWTAERPSHGVESWLRLPSPSTAHDLDELCHLTSEGFNVELLKPYFALRNELRRAMLVALRECTDREGSVYAVDGPEETFRCFRFWPHRAYEGMAWVVDPLPRGGDTVFVAHDFAWGIYATRGFDTSVDWALSIFGRPLLDAFERLQPHALSRVIRVDGKVV